MRQELKSYGRVKDLYLLGHGSMRNATSSSPLETQFTLQKNPFLAARHNMRDSTRIDRCQNELDKELGGAMQITPRPAEHGRRKLR